ncbi:MAG: hypothetical protein C4335_01120 [Armatimonadota bacterium]
MNSAQTTYQDVVQAIVSKVPQLLAAIAVLVLGYLFAVVMSAGVRRLLQRTNLDTRFRDWMGTEPEGQPPISLSAWVGKFVYYVLMTLVFIAFLQVLGLTLVAEPLNRFLTNIFAYVPRLIGAFALLVLAIVVARIARALVRRAEVVARLDERVKDEMPSAQQPVSRSAGDLMYWGVLVLFMPAILSALGLTGILEPVQGMLDKALNALPNLLMATLILVVGLVASRISRRIVTNFAASLGLDAWSERLGIASLLGSYRLSAVLGAVTYALVLLVVITATLQALAFEALTRPVSHMIDRVLAGLPLFFGAALVLVVANVIAQFVRRLVSNLLAGLHFDQFIAGLGIRQPEGAKTPSELVGSLAWLAILYYAVLEAAHILGLTMVADVLRNFLSYAGNILAGIAIFVLGLYLARLASDAVRASGVGQAGLLAGLTRAIVLVFVGAMALRQMGIANEIVILAFGLLMAAIALAAGLAFGIGGREVAARELENWLANVRQGESEGGSK